MSPPRTTSTRPAVRGRLARAWARNALGLRLTLGYALLFALSAVALFGLTFALLGQVLRQQDDAFVRTHLRLAEGAFAEGGLPAVRRHAAALRGDDRGEELLFRLSDARNRTLLLVPPDEWAPASLGALEDEPPRPGLTRGLYNERETQALDVEARALAGGYVLEVGMTSDERDDVLESFPEVFAVIVLPVLLLALFGGAFMARRALGPIRQLVGTLDAIAATGDVTERVATSEREGEFADLLRLFNRMLDRIEELVGRLRGTLDDVAHDLRTPLTRLRGTAELALQHERDPEAYRAALAQVVESAQAASATLDALMDVAEAEAGTLPLDIEPFAVADLVRDVADLYGFVAEEKGVSLVATSEHAAHARGDRRRVRQAVANLVDNAVKYTPTGGRVEVEVIAQGAETGVRVRDTGIGIPAGELPRIWERLYRGENVRHERGLGLGLSLVRAIAEAHGGRVEAESRPAEGATITLWLPAA